VWQTLKRGVTAGLPDRDITTIKDLIYYQYAKIIARGTLHTPDEVIYLLIPEK
jgi:hypothetical protein